MKLADLQQLVTELKDSVPLEWCSGSFSKRMVLLHSSISGAALACKTEQKTGCGAELAALVIQVAAFPAMFEDWGDIWGAQTLADFKTEGICGDLWDCLHKLHQYVAGLVGGRSDIVLLIKILQVTRAAAHRQGVDLTEAIQSKIKEYWQTA